ncbi:hypothetical protein LTR64_000031 [Lithohypha guttulata]|uniref:uncharacterized protein n=1 Tax=Lithohypha guttulata TaxID=1690604 RepID=UPI002DDF389B|nr:hypothetical protein LTR51_007393 [Lithohypha guttulata]
MAGHIDTCDEPPCLDSATTLKGLWLFGCGLLLHVTYALLNLVIRSACARLVHWVKEPRSKQDATFLSHEGVDFTNLDYLNSARQMIVVQDFNPYANRTRNQMQQIGKAGINFERLHEALLVSDNPSVLQNSSAAVQALTIEMSQDELAATYTKFQKLRRGYSFGDTVPSDNSQAHLGDTFVVYRAAAPRNFMPVAALSGILGGIAGGIVAVVGNRFVSSGDKDDRTTSNASTMKN